MWKTSNSTRKADSIILLVLLKMWINVSKKIKLNYQNFNQKVILLIFLLLY